MLGTADRETATWCSDFVGHREVREMEEGYSYAYNNSRDAVTMTPRREVVPLLLPDQFMGLPSLEGYIKFPEGFAAAPITLEPRDWPRVAEGFIPRETRKPTKPTAHSASGASPTGDRKGETLGEGDESEDRRRRDEKERHQGLNAEAKKACNRRPKRRSSRVRPREIQPDDVMGKDGRKPDKARLPLRGAQDHAGQSELPLEPRSDNAQREPGSNGQPIERHDPQERALKPGKQDHQRAEQDRIQRGLLGGAAGETRKHDRDEPDVGDIEPDI
jgi:Type IV secretory pathway, VirD4 components